MDKEKIKFHIRGLLEALGEDPDREGLIDTPARVAEMYEEVFEGISYSNAEIAEMFGKTFSSEGRGADEAVIAKDITVFSYCEHHMALMYDMTVNVGYIPKGKVLGLSKIARICDMAAKRLQLQEKLGRDIAEIISLATGSEDVGVKITGCHSCMTARGIKNQTSHTETWTCMGAFKNNKELKMQLN